jgi:hypothetical protein
MRYENLLAAYGVCVCCLVRGLQRPLKSDEERNMQQTLAT